MQNAKRQKDVEDVHWCPWNRFCKLVNWQCPGNVPIARRFPKLGNSLKPTGKQMKPERFRSWVWCPAPWAWDECMRLCDVSDACAFWHFLQEWEEDLDQPRTVEHLVSVPFHWFFVRRFLRLDVVNLEPLRLMRMKGDSWIPLAPQLQKSPSRRKKSNEILSDI